MSAKELTVYDYQDLIDQGWRRSGTFLYKFDMQQTCCKGYTIRLDAHQFTLSKPHRTLLRKWRRYLAGEPGNAAGGGPGLPQGAAGADGEHAHGDAEHTTALPAAGDTRRQQQHPAGGCGGGGGAASGAAVQQGLGGCHEALEGQQLVVERLLAAALASCVERGELPQALCPAPDPGSLPAQLAAPRVTVTVCNERQLRQLPPGFRLTSASAFPLAAAANKAAGQQRQRTRAAAHAAGQLQQRPAAGSGAPGPAAPPLQPRAVAQLLAERFNELLRQDDQAAGGGQEVVSAHPADGHINFWVPPQQQQQPAVATPAGSAEQQQHWPAASGVSGSAVSMEVDGALGGGQGQGPGCGAAPSSPPCGRAASASASASLAASARTSSSSGCGCGRPATSPQPAPRSHHHHHQRKRRQRSVEAPQQQQPQAEAEAAEAAGQPAGSGGDPMALLELPRGRLEVRLLPSAFIQEEFDLYKRYQVAQHGDNEAGLSASSYRRFLVESPLAAVGRGQDPAAPECGYGSFHQQYWIDGRLVAVGVVDILPRCLSSVYLFWDPQYAGLAPGRATALQEIQWVRQANAAGSPGLRYYYMGFYIHTCPKMRYKAEYAPSDLLCPRTYAWVRITPAVLAALDAQQYVELSQLPGAITFPNLALEPAGTQSEQQQVQGGDAGQGQHPGAYAQQQEQRRQARAAAQQGAAAPGRGAGGAGLPEEVRDVLLQVPGLPSPVSCQALWSMRVLPASVWHGLLEGLMEWCALVGGSRRRLVYQLG